MNFQNRLFRFQNYYHIAFSKTMPYHRLSTSKIAKIVGCHPNTVRIYEDWGFLPPIPRSTNGYRLFEEVHLDQMKLAWLAFHTPFPGRPIRKALIKLVKQAASGDLGEALRMAYDNRVLIQTELAQAEGAVDLVEHWASGSPIEQEQKPILIGELVTKIHVTHDMLRNWERNNMIHVPRHPVSGYRLYGTPEIARARIIRMLRTSGYSTLAILRMLVQLDRSQEIDIRRTLDTPPEDEEILYAADRWLTTLQEMEFRAESIIQLLKERLAKLSNC